MKPASFFMKVLTVCGVLWALGYATGGSKVGLADLKLKDDKIAVIPIYGELQDPGFVVHLLHRYRDDVHGVKAVVLAIDSPGGGVAAAQEICEAIKGLQDDGIVVVAAMGSMAASGGYYIAAPADRIVANAGTLTGSIGVIMESFNAKKVLDKVGVDFEVVKSGEFKDAFGFHRGMTGRERVLFQGIIDDVYNQFLDIVSEQRKTALSAALAAQLKVPVKKISDLQIRNYVRSFADGRVFSGRKAKENGLVDELGGLDVAIQAAADLAELDDPSVITYREPKSLSELLTGISKADIKGWAHEALGGRIHRFGLYAW